MIRHLARKPTIAQQYLDQLVSFGGVTCTLGEAIQQLQREGHSSGVIDAWIMGALRHRRMHG